MSTKTHSQKKTITPFPLFSNKYQHKPINIFRFLSILKPLPTNWTWSSQTHHNEPLVGHHSTLEYSVVIMKSLAPPPPSSSRHPHTHHNHPNNLGSNWIYRPAESPAGGSGVKFVPVRRRTFGAIQSGIVDEASLCVTTTTRYDRKQQSMSCHAGRLQLNWISKQTSSLYNRNFYLIRSSGRDDNGLLCGKCVLNNWGWNVEYSQ